MMYGYAGDWWAVFFVPVVLWALGGPFVMAGLGVWNARRPGWKPRLTAVLVPAVPVVTLAVVTVLPTDTWDEETWLEDLLGFLIGYVGLITVLPWLLGFLVVRVTRLRRARRRN
ncbi:hypothetical protein OHV05_31910 [Kitasatospora sp. NBC_00070]|uniref:hypothetical protein n=1 Tax=Kitasatospora sp. NBC_00070 TaxID=2975962 RepID=UPI0032458BD2